MNKLKSLIISACILTTLSFSSCNKIKEKLTPKPDSSVPSATLPSFGSGIDGALVSVRVFFSYDVSKFSPVPLPLPVPPVDIETETATALFGNLATGSFENAGTVSVNSHNLDKLSNNSYVATAFDYEKSDFSLDFSSGSNWIVSGSGSIPAFTYNHADAFPTYSGKSSMPETASSATGLTFSLTGISNADSIYVVLIGSHAGTPIIKRLGKTATSVSFSSGEVSSAGTTSGKATGMLQVCPFRVKMETINTKQYALIKEYCATKSITIN